jgi:hypothetical protein
MMILLQITTLDNEFLKTLEEGVLSSASWLNTVLFIGGGLLITINLYRLFKHNEIEINGLKLPLNKSWIVVLAYSLAHLYCSIVLTKATSDYISEERKQIRDTIQLKHNGQMLWNKLTLSGDFVFRRMEKRTEIGKVKLPFTKKYVHFYDISLLDISTWIYLGLVLMILNGIPDYTDKGNKRFWIMLSIAVLFAIANWLMGTIWTAKLSELLKL